MKLYEMNGTAGNSNGDSKLRATVLNSMRTGAPILEYAEFYPMVGNADTPRKVQTIAGGDFRALNANHTATDSDPEFGAIALKIMGGKVRTDKAHERRGADLASVHLADLTSYAEALGRHFQDRFLNSTISATAFAGLKAQMPAERVVKFIGDDGGLFPAGSDSADVKKQRQFWEYLRLWVAKTKPTVLFGNIDLISRMTSVQQSLIRTQTVTDALTQVSKTIYLFGDVPIVDSGYNKDESAYVITNTETLGASAGICTSLYGIRFGERKDVTLASNVGIQVDTKVADQFIETFIDFDMDMDVLNDKALFQLSGIRLDT